MRLPYHSSFGAISDQDPLHLLLRLFVRSLWVILPICFLVPNAAQGQAFPIFNGTVNTCVGAFLDSGGEGAVGYGNNENYTYTICPDNPTDAISLQFLTFNLSAAGAAPGDRMFIYDGNSTAAPTLGNYAGTALQGVTVSASPLNSSGCLTIVFESNNTGTGVFAASISCYTPCARPTAIASMSEAAPAMVCIGEAVTFNSTGSFAAPGFAIASRQWEWGDGTFQNGAPAVASHAYSAPGAYTAQLYLVDNNGCASTNRVDLEVLVGTEPDFIGTGGDVLGCVGETLCLDAVVNATTFNELPTGDLGNGVFLPDDVGSCFNAELTFTQFAAGQTLNSINDLLSICVNIEHSFIGDLVVNIISPTGQTVTMHQQGGGATFLGVPVDNDLQPNAQGTCWQYCFSPSATNGTWVDNAGGTLPAGTYESLNNLNGLIGSQLNGIWQLQICDLWASDNGFVCDWNIDFDPALFPDLLEFTPVYGTDCDSSSWSGPNIGSATANCQGICTTPPGPGNYPYVYTVTDNFGCTYDTTVVISVIPPPVVSAGPDASTCAAPVQLGASITSGGFPTNCTYELWLRDSYGDGWTFGSSITIIVDGVSSTWTLGDGDLGFVTIAVNNGSSIVLDYDAAFLFNGEQGFTLFDSNTAQVYNSPNGPPSGIAWSGSAYCPGGGFTYSWSPTAGLSNPNIANPIATVAGTTVYCVTAYQDGHPGCPATDCMTITVDNTVDAGGNGTITVCSSSPSFGLFPLISGTPLSGGTWTAPDGSPHSATFQPGTDVPGIYTYTVVGSGACGSASASSTVTVSVNPLPNAGANANIVVCSTDASVNLFTQLGGTPEVGGSWSGPSGSAFTNPFNPATGSAGTYTYTIAGVAPCPSSTATVTVTIHAPPNAGNDGPLTLCSTGAPVSLLNVIGAAPGGSWSGPSGLAGDVFDPATNAVGTYTYTILGTAPCPSATADATVTVHTPPDPGTDSAITLCSTDAAASLFAQLGGTPDAGGTWSGPSAVVGGMIDPATMSAGAYVYTVAGTAPCPDETATVTVTINTPPDAGSDGSITLCSTDAAASLFAQLGGTPDAGGTWSGPSAVVGGMIDPATMSAGAYVYTVAGTAPCPDETATVTVTINTPPDAGSDGSITLCSTDAAASLFAQLGGTPDAGGTWSGPSAVVGGTIDPATMSAGAYVYTVAGTAPCPDETATVTVTINTPPDAGSDGSITLCSTDAAASLFAQLGGTPDAGGTWSGPSAVVGGMIDPATMSAGAYVYTVAGTAPCPDETATVTVTINTPPDAGSDGNITLCSTDAAASLFAQLGGTPDAGGTWSGPSAVIGGMIDPATMSAGAYVYTVAGTAPCPDETATVTVTINTPPDAGSDGSITLCSTDAAASLFAQLGGAPDAGGTWSGPSAVIGGMIDPATMSAGAYVYTVAGTAPCPDETATVTVTINTPPDPGTDSAITLCSTDAAASLFAQLGGTPDAGGTWSGPSAVVGGMIDPATMSAGAYVHTVAGTAPCPDETATVTVTINTPPDAGSDGSITLCSTDAAASLFAQLGGTPDAGGTWSGPSAVVGGMIDPATMSAGAYVYTVAGTAPCPDETATVTVTINIPPDPGSDGAITLCSTDAAASLFALLGGTPDAGGTWSGPSAVVGGMIDPATMSAGVYTYTAAGTAPCPDETATVTVTINIPPDPGTDSAITLCSTDAAASLFAQLGGTPDAGGTWSGPSAVVGGMIDPATMSAGAYVYTVAGTAPCPDETATVTVTINTPPDAGSDGNITLCSTDAAASLFAQLGGTPDAGGTWSGPSAVIGGMIDPATMSAGVYTYTAAGTAPCPDETATVTVTINIPPDPGSDGAITLCSTDAAASLFALLGGTPDAGGTWSGPSAVVSGMIDPATMSAGAYVYTVAGTAPCPNETATVNVTINPAPDAGVDGSIALCITSPAVSLFAQLGGTPDAGGTWNGPSPVIGGQFDPTTMTAGAYIYSVSGIAPCPSDQSTVTVNVVTNPDPGTPGAATLCSTDASIDLFATLNGTPDAGGIWTGPSTVVAGQFDPATNTAGVYTYTIAVPPPCVSVSSTVTITLVQPPNAGTDGSLTLCISSPATSLFTSLNGSPNAGGTWSGPSPVVGGQFDPATMTAGDYLYTVNGTAPCPSASATVSVSVATNPDPGTPGAATLCSTDASIDLFATLNGTPDAGGTWTGPSTVVAGQFDPATNTAGVYTYTIAVPPPCVSVSSTVTITLVQPPNAGTDGSLTLCISSPATSLFTSLNGSPNAGGTWSGPSPVVGGQFDPATMTAGDYLYTVNGTAPCPSASATVSVSVATNPDPGTPGAATLCSTDASIDLFATLNGTPDAGGTWTGPSTVVAGQFDPATNTAGVYTYTIAVPPPCVSVSSTVTITLVQPPNAGTDGSLTLCISSPSESMVVALNGAPDAGGTWSGPSAVVGGQFDPSTMNSGLYTYTVAGTTPCPAASSDLAVVVVAAPDAGLPGNAILCAIDAEIDLFAELGGTPDAGGAWTGPSAIVDGSFDPATMAAGIYTYTISVPPPCVNASSTVTIDVIQPPDAGTDGSLVLCISSPAGSLFTSLGGSPQVSGTWSGPSVLNAGSFDPATMIPGIYTYTVSGTSPCPADAATVEVTVVSTPDPGGPGFLTACASDAPSDLFTRLEGAPDSGGTWSGPGGVMNGTFDPATDAPGVYTYTISVPPPCSSVSSTVTVDVIQPPNAGLDGSITVCATGEAVDLFGILNGSPEMGGTWTGSGGSAFDGSFDPVIDPAGIYTYQVAGTSPCPADIAYVTVAITNEPFAGNNAILNLCTAGSAIDIFPSLGGADIGGTWSAPGGISFDGTFTPGTSPSGAFTYTVIGTDPCPSASATIIVDQLSDPFAGIDGAMTLCSSNGVFDPSTALTGSPDLGGLWYAPNGTMVTGALDALSAAQGTYTYVVTVPPPCVNDTALVAITIIQAVDAGVDGSITICSDEVAFDLFDQLGGSPDMGGTWQGPNGVSTGTFTPGEDAMGTYSYTMLGTSPCPNDWAIVVVDVEPLPNAGTDGATTVCPGAPNVNLFALLGGSPDAGGSWTGPGGLVNNGIFVPSTDTPGVYTYTVYGTVCPNVSTTSTVSIFTVPAPNAGPDQIVCALTTTLNATGTWASGVWTGPPGIQFEDPSSPTTMIAAAQGGSYELIWTVITSDGCYTLDKITIVFTDPILPTMAITDAICYLACDGTAIVSATGGNVEPSGYSYQWSNDLAGNVPMANGICAGSYTVTVLDTNACDVTVPFIIGEPEPLMIDVITTTPETCPGSCDGTLTVIDPEGTLFSIGATYAEANLFTGLCSGPYAVQMMNASGCVANGAGVVGSPSPVLADFVFGPDTVFIDDPVVDFANHSTPNAITFHWDFGGIGSSTDADPTFTFPGGLGDLYEVCLTAMDANGCADSICAPVDVLDILIVYVPNAFSPNGDGVNDDFLPIFNLPWVVDYQFMVFNRWGEQIFGTDLPGKPWNGNYSDVVSQEDVYVWKLICRDKFSGERIERIGHVTLLK
ncbi:MAG: gliding motility-associated C-terminal domain-containing protein [Flavobacteriales bacterium]|nr:gliding motility-associated C-terminal domain-containing protein [Flavobacteriales bacterium]